MIKLYTLPYCFKCKYLKKLLNQKGILFEEICDADEMLRKGYDFAPILEVDGTPYDYGDALKRVEEMNA